MSDMVLADCIKKRPPRMFGEDVFLLFRSITGVCCHQNDFHIAIWTESLLVIEVVL